MRTYSHEQLAHDVKAMTGFLTKMAFDYLAVHESPSTQKQLIAAHKWLYAIPEGKPVWNSFLQRYLYTPDGYLDDIKRSLRDGPRRAYHKPLSMPLKDFKPRTDHYDVVHAVEVLGFSPPMLTWYLNVRQLHYKVVREDPHGERQLHIDWIERWLPEEDRIALGKGPAKLLTKL